MRLGFFGGTFDPPHLGHAAVAQAAADRFGLDEVLWVPVGRQPLKDGQSAGYADRLTLVRLACAVDVRFRASELDAPRADGAANFTVDTLRRLRVEGPEAEIFCLAGADSFADLARWREPEALLRLAEWIVISRPGFALREPRGMALSEAQHGRVHLLDAVHEDVSATALRERLGRGDACRDVLAAGVADYIEAHGLYREQAAAGGRVG